MEIGIVQIADDVDRSVPRRSRLRSVEMLLALKVFALLSSSLDHGFEAIPKEDENDGADGDRGERGQHCEEFLGVIQRSPNDLVIGDGPEVHSRRRSIELNLAFKTRTCMASAASE